MRSAVSPLKREMQKSRAPITNCLHVRIKATAKELRQSGIGNINTVEMLLSGMAFAVERITTDRLTDRKRVWLVHPTTGGDWIWVWEELTERINGGERDKETVRC
jgi:hypothetical protein